MIGKRYETEKKIWGGQGGNRFTGKVESGQSDHSVKTSQSIADEYGINERTVRRSEEFSRVVDILPDEAKENVLKGEENVSRSSISTINKMDAPTQKKFIKEVEKETGNALERGKTEKALKNERF
ncbi:MAG: hypothetical protein VB024_10675 [Dysgonamonadaceae bacterium]|nr:hypothetical protein [Dysgonamonadaceae bacterium]